MVVVVALLLLLFLLLLLLLLLMLMLMLLISFCRPLDIQQVVTSAVIVLKLVNIHIINLIVAITIAAVYGYLRDGATVVAIVTDFAIVADFVIFTIFAVVIAAAGAGGAAAGGGAVRVMVRSLFPANPSC